MQDTLFRTFNFSFPRCQCHASVRVIVWRLLAARALGKQIDVAGYISNLNIHQKV